MLQQKISKVNPSIFRAYDIRGVVGDMLTPESVYAIGKAIGSVALDAGEKSLAIGRDGRLSGPDLVSALCEGVLSTGCNVINIGMVPTPVLYYAANVLDTRSGIMLTGSHNPPEYNGLKIVINGKTLAEQGIQDLCERINENRLQHGKGELQTTDVIERYISQIVETVKLTRPLKVVIDSGNGVPGIVAPELYRQMGCDVHEIFCDVDGNFPNHHPDPSQTENLQDLIKKVREVDADMGLAFDGDGDRLGVVTRKGDVIWPDRQLMLFAKSILAKNPGAKIIYDVKCTSHLATLIKEHGGEPIMWKTGHSLIKSKLAETKALLAGEMSGHIFLKDRWYGFDDAIYAGARLLEILAEETLDIDALFETIPNSINTPELKIFVSDDEKFQLMDKLISSANFKTADEIMTIDGLRVNFANGWGLVRSSNTTPCLVLRFEAESESVLSTIQELFRDFLLAAKPDLVLPF
ncbi:MAG: phosphomannomutase/phosphoglucomutase [Gammaproteobacteria bacterium]|nr:phosphomannomutase/phosphoglucomutase [Gammaproteobacteria bacterium]